MFSKKILFVSSKSTPTQSTTIQNESNNYFVFGFYDFNRSIRVSSCILKSVEKKLSKAFVEGKIQIYLLHRTCHISHISFFSSY